MELQATPLPVFLLLLLRLEERARPVDAVRLGLTLAWAMYCDPYYAVFCVLMAAAWLLHASVSVGATARDDERRQSPSTHHPRLTNGSCVTHVARFSLHRR